MDGRGRCDQDDVGLGQGHRHGGVIARSNGGRTQRLDSGLLFRRAGCGCDGPAPRCHQPGERLAHIAEPEDERPHAATLGADRGRVDGGRLLGRNAVGSGQGFGDGGGPVVVPGRQAQHPAQIGAIGVAPRDLGDLGQQTVGQGDGVQPQAAQFAVLDEQIALVGLLAGLATKAIWAAGQAADDVGQLAAPARSRSSGS